MKGTCEALGWPFDARRWRELASTKKLATPSSTTSFLTTVAEVVVLGLPICFLHARLFLTGGQQRLSFRICADPESSDECREHKQWRGECPFCPPCAACDLEWAESKAAQEEAPHAPA